MRSAEPPTSSGTRAARISSACCEALRVATGVAARGRRRDQRRPGRVPVPRQLARHPAPELRGVAPGGRRRRRRTARSTRPARCAPRGARVPRCAHVGGHLERRVRSSRRRLPRRARPRRRPSGAPCASAVSGLVRRAEADVRAAADQRRARRLRLRGAQRRVDRRRVVAVDAGDHVPAVGLEARRACRRGTSRATSAVDRDAVVVVEHDELAEPEVRRRATRPRARRLPSGSRRRRTT